MGEAEHVWEGRTYGKYLNLLLNLAAKTKLLWKIWYQRGREKKTTRSFLPLPVTDENTLENFYHFLPFFFAVILTDSLTKFRSKRESTGFL